MSIDSAVTNHVKEGLATAQVSGERLQEIIDGCEGVQGGPWKLDKYSCYIWAPSEKGGDFPLMDEPGEKGRVAELRGWGYYTGKGHGALGLGPDEARARQKLTGEHVARLDPATVKAMATELLAFRRAPSSKSDEQVSDIKKIATQFFYWWWNHPGSNTEEGFDDWAAGPGAELLAVRASRIPDKGEVVAWQVVHGGGATFWNVEDNALSNAKATGGTVIPLYASPQPSSGSEVVVKPLAWRGDFNSTAHADSIFGQFAAWIIDGQAYIRAPWFSAGGVIAGASEDDAKAGAVKLIGERISSALTAALQGAS